MLIGVFLALEATIVPPKEKIVEREGGIDKVVDKHRNDQR